MLFIISLTNIINTTMTNIIKEINDNQIKTTEKGVDKIYTKIKYNKYYNYYIKYKGEYYA